MNAPACRSCGTSLVHTVIDLGAQPLSNAYLDEAGIANERSYPLHARFCSTCFLVQVDDVVPPEEIFEDYAYFSSYSDSWLQHAEAFVDAAIDRFGLDGTSLVVELASNDGYLLTNVVARGIPALGIEPAQNVAAVAIERGVPTEARFFGSDVAEELRASRGGADLIVANNVLAHVPDLNDFVAGISALLAAEGAVSVEVPHLLRLVQEVQFDTIYHEHYSYFSLHAAVNVFARHGLRIFDVQELSTHGGSLRLFACHEDAATTTTDDVARILAEERSAQLDRPEGFVGFAAAAARCRADLLGFLDQAYRDGRRVVAYGAAAKGNTLLNYAGVTSDLLEYVVDRNPAKQGRLLPGSHVPILDPERIVLDEPDFVLILPWNIRHEIIEQMRVVRDWGGRFVIAIPEVEVL